VTGAVVNVMGALCFAMNKIKMLVRLMRTVVGVTIAFVGIA
jgi:hypothetical protein